MFDKGYRVLENGEVLSHKGKIRKLREQIGKSGFAKYLRFNASHNTQYVLVHKLAGYQKFGDRAFEDGAIIRHLDGNIQNNSPHNLELKFRSFSAPKFSKPILTKPAECKSCLAKITGKNKKRRSSKEKEAVHRRTYRKKRRERDMCFKLKNNVSNSLRDCLKSGKSGISSTEILKSLGYSIEQLKDHLESLFSDGMTWENYGVSGWQIDHIKPSCSFLFESISDDQFKECWSLSNLRPLWATENFRKSLEDRKLSIKLNTIA